MSERSRVLTAACAGAVLGGIWGWLHMTEGGRRLRDRIEPGFDQFLDEIGQARATGDNTKAAIDEVRQLLTDITHVKQSVSAE